MKKATPIIVLLTTLIGSALWIGCTGCSSVAQPSQTSLDRARQLKDLKFGMFICWSFSTFSGHEWTRGASDVAFFQATGCDVDQWVRTAKEAQMGYILFLAKHHDGFCLWDTQTTQWKVTNSPLKKDVLAELRKACDKYGIKLALYFSEGDWTWIEKDQIPPDSFVEGDKNYDDLIWWNTKNAEIKKTQLKELCTLYGPIEFFWMDHAIGDGGLDHQSTADWIHQFQPDCFVGFNHGRPAGRLCLRERGRPGTIGDTDASEYNKEAESRYKDYLIAEFTYPIQPPCPKGAQWFYSHPDNENICQPAEKIYADYLGAVHYGNIFSIDVGPRPDGQLRDIDIQTLKKVGQYIRGELKPSQP